MRQKKKENNTNASILSKQIKTLVNYSQAISHTDILTHYLYIILVTEFDMTLIREMDSERNMIKAKRRVLLLISIFLFSAFTGIYPIENCIASENTIYVDDSGGKNYTSIQPAIDAANSGDTIYVYSGTYNENIGITEGLTLIGQNKDTTIIDGGKNSYVVYAYGTSGNEIEIHISGFTIRNAGGTGNDCIAQ